MAFATANVRSGVAGNLKIFAGDWSGSIGDASGTITLSGGRVYLTSFQNQDAGDTKETLDPIVSYSGSTITITVGNKQNVTQGTFIIIYS